MAYNFSTAKIRSLKTLDEACRGSLCLFDGGGVLDVGHCGFDLEVAFWGWGTETLECFSCFFGFISSNGIPWRFGSKVGAYKERDWPDPLKGERQSPGDVATETCHGSDDT